MRWGPTLSPNHRYKVVIKSSFHMGSLYIQTLSPNHRYKVVIKSSFHMGSLYIQTLSPNHRYKVVSYGQFVHTDHNDRFKSSEWGAY